MTSHLDPRYAAYRHAPYPGNRPAMYRERSRVERLINKLK